MIQFVGLLLLFLFLGLIFNLIQFQGFFVIIAAGLILAITSYRIIYGLGLLILAISLSPEIQMGGIPLRIEDLLVPVVFFFWFFRQISLRRKFKPTKMKLPIALFLFFMAIATVHAFIVNPDMNRIIAFFHFLKHVEYILIFILVFNVVKTRNGLRFLSYCAIGAAFILALQSILMPVGLQGGDILSTFSGGSGESQAINRLRGVITETANIYGGFLMFNILIVLGFLLEEKRTAQKFLFGFIALCLLYPMLFTLSRSSYVGLMMGLIFLGFAREPKIIVFLMVAPLMALSVVPPDVLDRILSIYQAFTSVELTPAWQARLSAWELYLPTIIKHPFIGKGLYFIPPGEVDNELVLRGVETGILGLLSFLWVFISFFRRALFNFRQAMEPIDAQLNLGYLAGMVGLSFHSLAATSFTAIRTAEPIYFFSGLVLASYLIILDIQPEDTTDRIHQKQVEQQMERNRKRRERLAPRPSPADL